MQATPLVDHAETHHERDGVDDARSANADRGNIADDVQLYLTVFEPDL